jgi:protein gp37
MNKTSIEWTHRPETGGEAGGFTWNPIRARNKETGKVGTFCTHASPGCLNCYAEAIGKRFGTGLAFNVPNLDKIEFFIDEKILEEPLRRKKPATIFVGDMFDLFHEAIDWGLIGDVFNCMNMAQWHTFQVLTKRTARMKEFITDFWGECDSDSNIWLGTSVESQQYADERIPLLLQTPAAVRFLSVEPMLEAVRLDQCAPYVLNDDESNPGVMNAFNAKCYHPRTVKFAPEKAGNADGISWVICGGESGPGARPMHPDWARSLRDQCTDAGVPFFFKQWGEWMPHPEPPDRNGDYHGGIFLLPNGRFGNQGDWWKRKAQAMDRVGKNKAGAFLDGREWREFPAERTVSA